MSETADQSPYAPPRAVVSDVAPAGEAPPRPAQVDRAVLLIWIGFAIGIVSTVWNLINPLAAQQEMPVAVTLAFIVVGYLFVIWVYRAIGRGRNWARILYLVFAAFSALGLVYSLLLSPAMHFGIVRIALMIVSSVLHFYVAYLLLLAPARQWYAEMKGRA